MIWPFNLLSRARITYQRPEPKYRYTYEGHDESKAMDAAKRADELTKQRRRLAAERAGIRSPKSRPSAVQFNRRQS